MHAPSGGGDARIRIFTPTAELPFAGHPGTRHGDRARHRARARARDARDRRADRAGRAWAQRRGGTGVKGLDDVQPVPTWQPFEHEAELLAALGVARSGLPVDAYVNGPRHVYVELASEDAVAALSPDLRSLAALGEFGVSCFAGAGARWKRRMFAPALGVPEDPATGSAAGPLAVHLARHGRIAFGEEIEIRQGAELARPSLLRARASGSPTRSSASRWPARR